MWRYVFVFIICAGIALWYLNWGRVPLKIYPDTQSYQYVDRQLLSGQLPELAFRPPVYPLYLLVFGVYHPGSAIVISNILLGALGTVLLFWVLNHVSDLWQLNLALVIFLSLNYAAVSFQGTLFAESIGPVVMIFFLWCSVFIVTHAVPEKLDVLLMFMYVLSGSLIMFLKPQFILLPLVMAGYILAHRWDLKRMIMTIICIHAGFILMFMGYNWIRSGKPVISENGGENVFGKTLTAGILDDVQYLSLMPGPVKDMAYAYMTTNRSKEPYDLLHVVQKNSTRSIVGEYQYMDDMNRYIFSKPDLVGKYIRYAFTSLPEVMSGKPDYYLPPGKRLLSIPGFSGILAVFELLNGAGLIGIGIAVCIYLVMLFRDPKRAFIWGMILVPVVYEVIIHFAFVYTDAYRLRIPVVALTQLCVFSPLVFFGSRQQKRVNL